MFKNPSPKIANIDPTLGTIKLKHKISRRSSVVGQMRKIGPKSPTAQAKAIVDVRSEISTIVDISTRSVRLSHLKLWLQIAAEAYFSQTAVERQHTFPDTGGRINHIGQQAAVVISYLPNRLETATENKKKE